MKRIVKFIFILMAMLFCYTAAAAQTQEYLLSLDFNDSAYTRGARVIPSSGTAGVNGWSITGGDLGSSRYFKIVEHPLAAGRNAAEIFIDTSNRQFNLNLSSPIERNTGKYIFSFDAELEFTASGAGSYSIGFAAGSSPVYSTSVRFFPSGAVTVNNSSSDGRNQGAFLTHNLPNKRWHRITAVIDTNAQQATWFINDTEHSLIDDIANERGITEPFDFDAKLTALHIRGAGGGTLGVLRLDNVRLIKGDADSNPPDFFPVQEDLPAPEATQFTYMRLGIQVGRDSLSRNFAWQTPNTYQGTSRLQYIPAAALVNGQFPANGMSTVDAEFVEITFGTEHSFHVSLNDLAPNTEFAYRVGGYGLSGEEIWGEVYTFSTHDGTGDFEFVIIGDAQIRFLEPNQDSVRWPRAMNVVEEMFPDASFIVSTGDQVESPTNTALYDVFFLPDQLRRIPLAPTVGNHDYNSYLFPKNYNVPNRGTFSQNLSGPNYWYTYNNVLFMHLNLGYYNTAVDTAEHEAFMKSVIEDNPNVKWRVLVIHYAMYSGGVQHSMESYTMDMRAAMIPLIDRMGIDIVLNGHDHVFARSHMMLHNQPQLDQIIENSTRTVTDPKGTLYMTFASSSGNRIYQLWPWPEHQPWLASSRETLMDEPSFAHVTVTDTSFKIDTWGINTLELWDSFEVVKSAGPVQWIIHEAPATPESSWPSAVQGQDYVLPNTHWFNQHNYISLAFDDKATIVGNHGSAPDRFWGWSNTFPATDFSQFSTMPIAIDLRLLSKEQIDNLLSIDLCIYNAGNEQWINNLTVESAPAAGEWFTAVGKIPTGMGLRSVTRFRLRLVYRSGYNPNIVSGSIVERFDSDRVFELRDFRLIWDEPKLVNEPETTAAPSQTDTLEQINEEALITDANLPNKNILWAALLILLVMILAAGTMIFMIYHKKR